MEEFQGLIRMKTCTVITASQYLEYVRKYNIKAIPTINIFTTKFDGEGLPCKAEARIVVLGILDTSDYNKNDKTAPVASHYTVRLIICIAVAFNRPLKQGDCKNAFVQSEINEIMIVVPPLHCLFALCTFIA